MKLLIDAKILSFGIIFFWIANRYLWLIDNDRCMVDVDRFTLDVDRC